MVGRWLDRTQDLLWFFSALEFSVYLSIRNFEGGLDGEGGVLAGVHIPKGSVSYITTISYQKKASHTP